MVSLRPQQQRFEVLMVGCTRLGLRIIELTGDIGVLTELQILDLSYNKGATGSMKTGNTSRKARLFDESFCPYIMGKRDLSIEGMDFIFVFPARKGKGMTLIEASSLRHILFEFLLYIGCLEKKLHGDA
ncbi:hypothetical protein M8C21_017012, partial [Ambrosia artemisiifolia]